MQRMTALRGFLDELRRRRVYRVAVVYAAVAFVIWQAAEIAFPALSIPDWALTLVVVLTLAGFPIAVVLAWAFDVTPEGVRRTEPSSVASAQGQRLVSRPLRFAVAVLLILSVAVASLWTWAGRSSSAGDLSASRVAVFPFVVHGDPALHYLRAGMAHLLSNALDGAGELRTVDPHALLSAVPDRESAPDPTDAQAIAARFNAGLYVLGSVVGSADRMEVTASLYDASSGERTTAEAVPGEEAEIQALVDNLARRLVVGVIGRPEDRLTRLAARTTGSVPALKAYLEGQVALGHGDIDSAVDAFGSALALDSTFVLARYKLAVATSWEGSPAGRAHALRALRDSADLQPRERRLLVALNAFLTGDMDTAEEAYRAVLGEYPDEFEANYMLGEALWHLGPTHGRSMQRARAPFEQALAVSPSDILVLHHLAVLAIKRGDRVAADSLLSQALATVPAHWFATAMRVMEALAGRDATLRAEAEVELQAVETLGLFASAMAATSFFQQPHEGRWVVEALTAPHRPTQVRAAGHAMLAYLAAARGRWSEAERELVEVDRLYPVGASHRAYLALLPFAPYERGVLEERLAEVEGWDESTLPASTAAMLTPPVDAQRAIRLYLLGLLNARLGREAEALAYADRLENVEWAVGGNLSATLVPGIRAALTGAYGAAEEALRTLEVATFEGHYDEVYTSPVIAMAAERYLMAELLDATGRGREALGWFASLGDLQAYEIAYVAPAHLRRAQIHERLGERQEAAQHYERFVELWKDCDPGLRPLVEDAETRLAELRSN
jgi:tetratricopeptide (TPR) repeat protein